VLHGHALLRDRRGRVGEQSQRLRDRHDSDQPQGQAALRDGGEEQSYLLLQTGGGEEGEQKQEEEQKEGGEQKEEEERNGEERDGEEEEEEEDCELDEKVRRALAREKEREREERMTPEDIRDYYSSELHSYGPADCEFVTLQCPEQQTVAECLVQFSDSEGADFFAISPRARPIFTSVTEYIITAVKANIILCKN
jgi:hypothetical protein